MHSYTEHTHTHSEPPTTDVDDKDEEHEEWNPTPEAFQAYLKRELEFARHNIMLLLGVRPTSTGRWVSMTAKELKNDTLHSIDTIEAALSELVQAGRVKEVDGKYLRA